MRTLPPDRPAPAGPSAGRRRVLGGGLSLLALSWLPVPAFRRGGGTPFPDSAGDGYVVIDGWVLPARYFRD